MRGSRRFGKAGGFIAAALLIVAAALPVTAVTDRPLTPVNSSVVLEAPAADSFTFAVFGDFRPLRRDRPYPPVYEQTLAELNLVGPAFIVGIGDAYYGYGGSTQRFMNELDHFAATLRPLDMPFYNVIGNHEIAGDAERRKIVTARFGRSYGSLDYSGSHFILLNTEEAGSEGGLSAEQLGWLKKDLDDNRGAPAMFVFLHRPLFSVIDPDLVSGKSFRNREVRDALHALFVQYRVKAVFAGHEHLYNTIEKDGVRYFITGGGGAPLYKSPDQGGIFEYLLVTVTGGDVTLRTALPYTIQRHAYRDSRGFDTKAEIEVSNISGNDLAVTNIPVLMPRAPLDRYSVTAAAISVYGKAEPHPAKVRRVKDNGDGTATLGIETFLPRNGAIRISVEAGL